MNYKLLTPYEKAELWSQIALKSKKIVDAANNQSTLAFYLLFNELQSCKTMMERHETAKALQNANAIEELELQLKSKKSPA